MPTTPAASRLAIAFTHSVTGGLLALVAGMIGGGIMAGPFWYFGMIIGMIYASPVGFVVGGILGAARRPIQGVFIACAFHFAGAVLFGLLLGWATRLCDPFIAANIGQVCGAVAGLVAGLLYRPRVRDPLLCVQCGYNLTGNESMRCPECGQDIPPEQMETIQDLRSQ